MENSVNMQMIIQITNLTANRSNNFKISTFITLLFLYTYIDLLYEICHRI